MLAQFEGCQGYSSVLPCYKKYNDVPFLVGIEDAAKREEELALRITGKTYQLLKCPKQIFGTDYLLISFKGYKTIPYEEIKNQNPKNKWMKVATLATPYSESLQNNFIKDFSRIGTPFTANNNQEKKWIKKFVD